MRFGDAANLGRPVGGYDPRTILDARDSNERMALMRQMGVANLDPPLPHSPCLKNIRTGTVLPWNELLAAQRDLVVCCDEDGNTDEAVWGPKVIEHAPSNRELSMQASQALFKTQKTEFTHNVPDPQLNKGPSEYEKQGVVSFSDVQKLREELRGESESDHI